jgi:hypothetical protein
MITINSYFADKFPHINFQGLNQSVVSDFMSNTYLIGLDFPEQMECLADYIVANNLTEVSF